ncbi:MAG: T9SS type A sorting domain-containing protein [Bacteroidales bacterium]|jgi:hypothetical protein|nr:T9SS type A sorting domain-containing protein [Bacteroidales bacterium]
MKKIILLSVAFCLFAATPMSAQRSVSTKDIKSLVQKKKLKDIHAQKAVAKASDNVVLFEDFSKFTAGSEATPDTLDLSLADEGWISSQYTTEDGWWGVAIYQAGGKVYIGIDLDYEETGTLETPLLDLSGNSGNFTVKVKAKSTNEDGDYLAVYAYDEETMGDEYYVYDYVEITNDWAEYTFNLSGGMDGVWIGFYASDYEVFVDDIQVISGTASGLSAPVALDPTNITATGFTANWSEVEDATGYELSIYTREGPAEITSLSEDFSACSGKGGNDDEWKGNIASNKIPAEYENAGWEFTKVYAASSCIKAGTGDIQGIVTTPALGLNGNAVLTFKSGAWDGNSEKTTLLLSISGGGELSVSSVTLVKGAFTEYSVNITGGTANSKITFKGEAASNSRFFLDNVLVKQGGAAAVPITGSPFTVATTSYNATGLTTGTVYYYTVKAKNETEVSAVSNEKSATPVPTTGIKDNEIANFNTFVSNGSLIINASGKNEVRVYNMMGQLMFKKQIINNATIPVGNLSSGAYIVTVGNKTTKVIL